MKLHLVNDCTDCPFSDDGTEFYQEGDTRARTWGCHAEYTPEGWPRQLPAVSERPPPWCPLREEGRVVVLRKHPR